MRHVGSDDAGIEKHAGVGMGKIIGVSFYNRRCLASPRSEGATTFRSKFFPSRVKPVACTRPRLLVRANLLSIPMPRFVGLR